MTPSPPPPPRQHPLPSRRLPRPTLPPYEANVLTGEPKGADYPEGQRITAVMVNNIVAARPQRGLSKADILFEIKVEGGITRFMPVFTDYKTSVRSALSAPAVTSSSASSCPGRPVYP